MMLIATNPSTPQCYPLVIIIFCHFSTLPNGNSATTLPVSTTALDTRSQTSPRPSSQQPTNKDGQPEDRPTIEPRTLHALDNYKDIAECCKTTVWLHPIKRWSLSTWLTPGRGRYATRGCHSICLFSEHNNQQNNRWLEMRLLFGTTTKCHFNSPLDSCAANADPCKWGHQQQI